MNDNTARFSSRVENYVKFRPGYPGELLEELVTVHGLNHRSICADIGSGTGIFTKLLLDKTLKVFAVEPNKEMRLAAEKILAGTKGFVSVDGTAENTGLDPASVDFITSAQAFHWFDLDKSLPEFRRILKDDGKVFLVWNKRNDDSEFLKQYEIIVRKYCAEYDSVNHHNCTEEKIRSCYSSDFGKKEFTYSQVFDFESVMGRLSSSSYAPLETEEAYSLLRRELETAFNKFQKNGHVVFSYTTELCSGRLK